MILLTIEESEKQIVSGIPEIITISSSIPCTIFYTLDGTEPDSNSDIYVDGIYLTYDQPSVTLMLKAQSISDESDLIEMTWGVLTPEYNRTALIGKEGINVLPAGKTPIDSLAKDLDGNDARTTYIDFQDLDIKTNKTDRIGQSIPDDSSIPFVRFSRTQTTEKIIRTDVNDINFDPTAQIIIIDGYSGFDEQQVRLINRPHGTMSSTSKFFTERNHYDSMSSGDFVRYMYNPKTQKIIFYYRESLDNRWIISTQQVEAASLNLTSATGNPFVFRWIADRTQTKIF